MIHALYLLAGAAVGQLLLASARLGITLGAPRPVLLPLAVLGGLAPVATLAFVAAARLRERRQEARRAALPERCGWCGRPGCTLPYAHR
jgi:hypothetical protein